MDSNQCPKCSDIAEMDCKTIIQQFSEDQSNLLPMLHAVQNKLGYLPCEAMEEIAQRLSIPVSEVYGTATFYTLFSTKPLGTYVIRLCDSAPCHIEGSKAIIKAIQKNLGIAPGETTSDGRFTLQTVSCIGLCGVAPAIMVNEDVYGNLTPEAIPEILAKYGKEGG